MPGSAGNSTSGRVEPNSALGGSITYMLRHWQALTLFLRVAGAPLDNNICERALKMAIRHRKNSLFYKTLARCPRGRHLHEPDPHLPTLRRRIPSITSPNWSVMRRKWPQTPGTGCPGTIGKPSLAAATAASAAP